MKILAIEASAVAASAAVTDGGVLLAEEFTQTALTHSVTLLPAVDSVMKKSGLSLSEIDLVAVTEGPGSFSGLRIGVNDGQRQSHMRQAKKLSACPRFRRWPRRFLLPKRSSAR